MVKNYFLALLLLFVHQYFAGQVVSSNPAIPLETESVVITFYADKGNMGLKDYTGDVYAHTGVITDKSTGSSDWKYAPTWGDNDAKYKLVRTGTNSYQLTISDNIRSYYGVAEGEVIEKMAFVFRSADNSREGKDEGNKDIFVDVSDGAMSLTISAPQDRSFHDKGSSVAVEVNSIQSTSLKLFVNGVEEVSTANTEINYTLANLNLDKYELKAVASNGTDEIETITTIFVKADVIIEDRPLGLKRGVNLHDANSATVLLYAPYKSYVYLMGDFNNWEPTQSSMMKRDGDYFWLRLEGLAADTEYAYQFWMDGNLKIADPYTNKVLDPWNDKYIPEEVYPNLKAYPEGLTDNIVSVFNTNAESFSWDAHDYVAPKADDLVIYEILIRDFTANKDIKTITDTLSYLKRLGINAIELMPFNEFEGNDSWGYNPSFYFATDKAYGTENDYKTFINECHKNGIAVIMDLVLNHSYNQSPLAQMYWEGGKPSAINPWYNREHNMEESAAQWGNDFNHESSHTEELVDSICSYWMSEYKIDGFRFDFTKGFTNTSYPAGDWASAKDNSRITILKRMADEIWKINPETYVIFEHLSDNDEETILADHGIMLWGNANHNYNEATMGYNENGKSDLSWTSYIERGWSNSNLISYMESHDEERLMYRNYQYGNIEGQHNTKNKKTALKRMEAAAAIFFSTPGPKMVWQFGELGFDMSINRCEDGSVDDGCRLSKKPPVWQYKDEEERQHLYDVYQRLIEMKTQEEVFTTADFVMDVTGAVKKVALNLSGSDVRTVANFDMESRQVSPDFSATGWWYNVIAGDSLYVQDVDMQINYQPGTYAIYSQKKLTGFDPHTSVEDELKESNLKVYPNPFTNVLTIETEMPGVKIIEVFALTGNRLRTFEMTSNTKLIHLGDLPIGNYIIRVSTSEMVKYIKLLKQ
ncbi:alpha-amylase family glycosyl hydrolase [Carboxylicivirga sp. N1Y90]|uniref:alpha-amylase family glycosyl hydrolase n=1 Tax=Carboxylicivirga fragile TaxID=3417571 RepID=UPI003D32C0FE|nr:T9SS type A sorting domain-containing protein [Marinilabiliaceae bacterium N1Y90]